MNQQQLQDQRRQEDAVRSQVAAQPGIDAEEVDRRARHMRQQRELLIAKKKAERDEKVRLEEERKAKEVAADGGAAAVLEDSRIRVEQGLNYLSPGKGGMGGDEKGLGPSADEIAEMRRATMRAALARRMKMDLIDAEDAKISQMQESQFSELDKKLKQVEQLREDNRKREFLMNKQLERQQAQIARNVRLSAAEMDNAGNL